MGLLAKLGIGGVTKAVSEVGKVVDSLSTSAEERNALKAQVVKSVVDAQTRAIEAEAARGGLAALWRPITMLSFVALIWWYVLAATFDAQPPDMSGIPDRLWDLMQGGIFGYGTFRSAEKLVPLFMSRKERRELPGGE